jgi:ABC-type multidrug transport system fused ATPase/permease subunit
MLINTIRQIRSILRPAQWKKALLNVLLVIGNAFLEVFSLASVLPFILLLLDTSIIQSNLYVHRVYHWFGFQSENRFIIAAVFFLLFLFILKNTISILISYYQSRFSYDVSTDLSERAFREFYAQTFSAQTGTSSSLPTRNIIFIPTEFSIYVLLASITFLSEFVVFFLISLGIAIYNFPVFLMLALILGPALFLLYSLKRKKLGEIGQTSETLKPQSMKYVLQGIYAYVDAKIYDKESFFLKRFTNTQKRLNRNFALFNTLNLLPSRLIEVIAISGMTIIVIYSMTFAANKSEIIILLSLFMAAAYRVMPSLNRMFVSLVNIKTFHYTIRLLANPDAAHIFAQMKESSPERFMPFRESVALRNVSFTYSDEEPFQLKNVSFLVKKGEIVGLIGKSGAGKTTIINLLLRFLQEDSGEILLDGRPLKPEHTIAWHRLIGYVKQDPFILDGTIRENIAFGENPEEIDPERLENAVRQAGLSSFVAELPQELETPIGERGAKLSGGQRQRLAIARALYRNSEILIFDEATSELDSFTEREIVSAIETLHRQKKTILIIAHRLSTLKHCHRIYELKDGEISGVFRYADLAENKVE